MADTKKVLEMIKEHDAKYVDFRFTDPRGNLLLMGGGTWMAMGIFVMRRMINFKI